MNEKDILNAVLRKELALFIKKTFNTVATGETYLDNWHIDAIAYHLMQCYQRKNKRLIITLPPRSLKSISASVAFPAWVLGRDPTSRIVCVSYASDLAAKHALDCRTVMSSPWYRDVFPRTRLHPEKNTVSEFMTTRQGYRLSTSVGGSLTGRGGNLIIIDDPHKADEVTSDTRRLATKDWYRSTLVSRLDNKKEDVIIVIQQRLHEDDLAGNLLETGDWVHLNLRAIAEEDESILIGENKYYFRKEGAVLHPAREPIEVLDEIKGDMGSYQFAAQYQQRPAPIGGGMIEWEWIRNYTLSPPHKNGDIIVQSWDTACSVSDTSDYTVCTTWLIRDQWYCLLDVFRQRVQPLELRSQIRRLAREWNPNVVLIEKMNASIPLIQELINETRLSIIPITPKGDKKTRMMAEVAAIESGRLLVPEDAPWLADFRNELVLFPSSKYDDQVDSVSQFLFWARHRAYGPPQIKVTPIGGSPRFTRHDLFNMRFS